MTQEDPVFKGMHHLYGGSSFGMFLKTLRACKNVEGALVNAEAKYKYLNSQGWYGGHRNRNAFTTQIAFETEAKEKIKK
jgi:hypothetical protein